MILKCLVAKSITKPKSQNSNEICMYIHIKWDVIGNHTFLTQLLAGMHPLIILSIRISCTVYVSSRNKEICSTNFFMTWG